MTADGRSVRQEWGWSGAEGRGERRLYARQVTLARPGGEDVAVVTDLLDQRAYPAADLLAVYLTRWQIETVFQQITEVFHLDRLIGCRPAATVFQASLCLVVFNVLQLVRGYIAAGRPGPVVEAVSGEQIFADLTKDLVGLHEVLSVEEVAGGVTVPGATGRCGIACGAHSAGCGRRGGRRCGARSRGPRSRRR